MRTEERKKKKVSVWTEMEEGREDEGGEGRRKMDRDMRQGLRGKMGRKEKKTNVDVEAERKDGEKDKQTGREKSVNTSQTFET